MEVFWEKIKNEREDPHGSAFLFPQHKVRNGRKKKGKRKEKKKGEVRRIECYYINYTNLHSHMETLTILALRPGWMLTS